MNAADFSRLLLAATQDTVQGNVFRLPWETGRAGVVLGGSSGALEHLTVQGPPPLMPCLKRLLEPIADSSSSRCVVPRLRLQGDDALDEYEKKAIAIERWRQIVNLFPASCAVGYQVVDAEMTHDPDESVHALLGDIFADKAAGTLESRAGSLWQYIAWHHSARADDALPVHEEIVYEYLKHLRKDSAAASGGTQFLEALSLAFGSLGLLGVVKVRLSRRCLGAALTMSLKSFPLTLKQNLLVSDVMILENKTWDAETVEDRVFCGHCCLLLFGRLRWSDGQRIIAIQTEQGDALGRHLEAEVFRTRTARSTAAKAEFLSVVMPVRGLSERSWYDGWNKARKEAGLATLPLLGCGNTQKFPALMPTPSGEVLGPRGRCRRLQLPFGSGGS